MTDPTSITDALSADASTRTGGSREDSIDAQRESLRQALRRGATAAEIVERFTHLVDERVTAQYRAGIQQADDRALSDLRQCCLVAVGGYGRRELAPHSDIDVMLLSEAGDTDAVTELSKHVFHHLWDLGFQVGHSVRTIADCLTLAESDLAARTSLLEARFLQGNAAIFQRFRRRFIRRMLGRRAASFIQQKVEERQRDYVKFGETVFLLEPNVKKSKGGLRDLHLLQWVGMAKYQAVALQDLANRGLIAREEYLAIREARDFLWRIRCVMHFEAGRAQDVLLFEEQERLASYFGLRNQPNLLAVEQFMQQYYRYTMDLHDRCTRFIEGTRDVSWWTRIRHLVPPPLLEGRFQIVDGRLTIPDEHFLTVLRQPELLLRFFQLSQERSVPIARRTLDALHQELEAMPNEPFHTPSVSGIFRAILANPGRVADVLSAMHRARLLEKLVPAFARVRGLMQFNQYHKYTVDEHSIRAVREAERVAADEGPLGTIYAAIQQKDLLHLALLLHDLGKGKPEDHSEVGRVIAQRTSERLGLTAAEARTLEFLVYKHLLMAHTAFRRDIHDERVVRRFGREVKTPEVLRQMFILTVADIAAVGPDVMNRWKETLLTELFHRTCNVLAGEEDTATDDDARRALVQEVAGYLNVHEPTALVEEDRRQWVESQLAQFPPRYLSSSSPERIAAHLRGIQELSPALPIVTSDVNAQLNVSEYTLIAHGGNRPGIVMNLTGVLAAMHLAVLDAQIITRRDGIVVDVFVVSDPDFDGPPSEHRLAEVSDAIIRVLTRQEAVTDLFERRKRMTFGRPYPTGRHPTEVHIDNETSADYTVIDVFADDQPGLLFVIARVLAELDLSIHAARIGSSLDQVVDVFSVTAHGQKIEDADTCRMIAETIRTAVDSFLDGQS